MWSIILLAVGLLHTAQIPISNIIFDQPVQPVVASAHKKTMQKKKEVQAVQALEHKNEVDIGTMLADSSAPISLDFATLSNPATYDNLPVDDVKAHPVEGAWASVMLIPQTHRYPGSDIADKKNDRAVVVQEEIYQIIAQAHDQFGMTHLLSEGDLYGPAAAEKVTRLSSLASIGKKLSEQRAGLEHALDADEETAAAAKQTLQKLDKTIAHIDRTITLAGGQYKLKSQGSDVVIYGAENKETLDQSAEVVRDYIYITDRLAQVQKGGTAALRVGNLSLVELLIQQKKLSRESRDSSEQSFENLENLVSLNGNTTAVTLLGETKKTFAELAAIESQVTTSTAPKAAAPSRSQNPYLSISDPNKLQEILKTTEGKMQEYVVDRRNKETAENYVKMLKEGNVTTGMIQYGADHEEGLVQELNKLGVSVVSVHPTGLN